MSEILAARGITVGHDSRNPVLVDASLSIQRGATLALLGANGAGKSTLLRTLVGAMPPSAGDIILDGIPCQHGRAALRNHRRRVQLVLQDPDDQLFSADVYQDVSFGPTNMNLSAAEIHARVHEALNLLGIAHLADRATHQLSYGERKRVATAGAVAMRPDVLLLDEPTAGLDPHGVADLEAALERVHQAGTTIVVATHDMDFALNWASEVAVVAAGSIIQGTPVGVLSQPDLIEQAHLRLPWPLWLARELELDAQPRNGAEVVELLRRTTHV